MKSLFFSTSMIFLALSASPLHAAPPFQSTYVDAFTPNYKPSTDTTRLRISAITTEGAASEKLALSPISVCNATACFRLNAPLATASLPNTASGTGATLVDMIVPRTDIQSVHIEGSAGSSLVTGEFKLSTPLALSSSSSGGEILLVFKKQVDSKPSKFALVSAVSGLLRDHGSSVYYHPSFATTALLPGGVEINIPAAGTVGPVIFNVAVLDTGDKYPLVDIYPAVKLLKPGEISLPASSPKDVGTAASAAAVVVRTRKAFGETGVIRIKASVSATLDSFVGGPDAASYTCAQVLAQNYPQLIQAMGSTGVVYTDMCADRPPYVHIAIGNKSFAPTTGLSIVTGSVSTGPTGNNPWLGLKRVTSYPAPNSQVIINGFTWAGDGGTSPNDHGYALGYVEEGAVVYGLNKVGGGTSTSSPQDGLKRGMIWVRGCEPAWATGKDLPLFNGYCNYKQPWIIVSSSTSIVNNGICATDSLTRAWSAFGTNDAGYFIFMSSASGTTTNAAEMCPAFQALRSSNAIRMDGSSAAGMVVDNIHKNPITGMDSFIYGTARYVAYGLRFASIIGTTPTVSVPTVNPPKDPCKVNPAACS